LIVNAVENGSHHLASRKQAMNVCARLVMSVALIYTGVSPVTAQQRSAERERTIRAEVKAAFDQYYTWFSDGRSDLVAERAYQAPSLFLAPAGPDVRSSNDAIRARFDAVLKPLIADGYSRSEMPNPSICVLNESTATVSGRYIRYRKDGSVMAQLGGIYIFTKAAGSWRIVALINHEPNKVLGCSD
jgi:hypothetical protein